MSIQSLITMKVYVGQIWNFARVYQGCIPNLSKLNIRGVRILHILTTLGHPVLISNCRRKMNLDCNPKEKRSKNHFFLTQCACFKYKYFDLHITALISILKLVRHRDIYICKFVPGQHQYIHLTSTDSLYAYAYEYVIIHVQQLACQMLYASLAPSILKNLSLIHI